MAEERVRRVLIVDDDSSVCATLKQHLEVRGYSVSTAGDAYHAWQMLQENPPVIVLDIHMPGMSGLEFMTLTRMRHPEIKCIVYSGDDEKKEEAFRRGAYQFCSKNGFLHVLDEVDNAFRNPTITNRTMGIIGLGQLGKRVLEDCIEAFSLPAPETRNVYIAKYLVCTRTPDKAHVAIANLSKTKRAVEVVERPRDLASCDYIIIAASDFKPQPGVPYQRNLELEANFPMMRFIAAELYGYNRGPVFLLTNPLSLMHETFQRRSEVQPDNLVSLSPDSLRFKLSIEQRWEKATGHVPIVEGAYALGAHDPARVLAWSQLRINGERFAEHEKEHLAVLGCTKQDIAEAVEEYPFRERAAYNYGSYLPSRVVVETLKAVLSSAPSIATIKLDLGTAVERPDAKHHAGAGTFPFSWPVQFTNHRARPIPLKLDASEYAALRESWLQQSPLVQKLFESEPTPKWHKTRGT